MNIFIDHSAFDADAEEQREAGFMARRFFTEGAPSWHAFQLHAKYYFKSGLVWEVTRRH